MFRPDELFDFPRNPHLWALCNCIDDLSIAEWMGAPGEAGRPTHAGARSRPPQRQGVARSAFSIPRQTYSAMRPPQCGQANTSIAKVRRSRSAHATCWGRTSGAEGGARGADGGPWSTGAGRGPMGAAPRSASAAPASERNTDLDRLRWTALAADRDATRDCRIRFDQIARLSS
jgi:hypothetical protein